MPVWRVLELGWPFTEGAPAGGRPILPDEIRLGVGHAMIAGARGIKYLDHNFGPTRPAAILGQARRDPGDGKVDKRPDHGPRRGGSTRGLPTG
jgi:hypothetical protein